MDNEILVIGVTGMIGYVCGWLTVEPGEWEHLLLLWMLVGFLFAVLTVAGLAVNIWVN